MAKTAKQLEVKTRHIYKPEIETCPHCGEPLRARSYYQWCKTVQQLDGAVYVASEAQECVNPRCPHQGQSYTSAAAQMVTVPGCTYGLDIIAQIGWWRDREHLNREQIHGRLGEREVQICERQVDHPWPGQALRPLSGADGQCRKAGAGQVRAGGRRAWGADHRPGRSGARRRLGLSCGQAQGTAVGGAGSAKRTDPGGGLVVPGACPDQGITRP